MFEYKLFYVTSLQRQISKEKSSQNYNIGMEASFSAPCGWFILVDIYIPVNLK